jgi:hypothetical protein
LRIASRDEQPASFTTDVPMPPESRGKTSDLERPDPAPAVAPNDSDAGDQDTIRERVTRLAFGGDPRRFAQFVDMLAEATAEGAEVILRGSAVTGHKWHSEEPFDADGLGTSDLDVTFVGGGMVALFQDFHIPGIHSAPFGEAHPYAAPALGDLRKRLTSFAGRPVNLQATTSLVQFVRDVVMDQPYLVLLKKPAADDDDRGDDDRDG